MTDTIKKIYIDSRYRTNGTDSDFKIDLPVVCNFSENTKLYISDIILPNSIKTINANNGLIYIEIYYDSNDWARYIFLERAIYTAAGFVAELETKVNAGILDLEVEVEVGYNAITNIITIDLIDNRANQTTPAYVRFVSDYSLETGASIFGVITRPVSSNQIIGLETEGGHAVTLISPYIGYLDLHSLRSIYITSSVLSTYDTLSNFGMSGIIKKVPMRANTNEIVYDNLDSQFDFVEVGKRTVSYVDIQLRDTNNNIIDLQNTHISFTLIFSQ